MDFLNQTTTKNNSNEIVVEKEDLLNFIYEDLQLYFYSPLSVICIIFNLLGVVTLLDTQRCKHPIYKYIRIYFIIGVFIGSFILLSIFTHVPRYLPSFSQSYFARIYTCSLVFSFTITFYFYGNVQNILMAIERLSTFALEFQSFRHLEPYKLSFYLFIACALINLPTFFILTAHGENDIVSTKLHDCERTNFGESKYSNILLVTILTVDNVITLIIEIVGHVLNAFYFQRFIENSFIVRNITKIQNAQRVQSNNQPTQTLNNGRKINWFEKKIDQPQKFFPLFTLGTNITQLILCFIYIETLDDLHGYLNFVSEHSLYLVYLIRHGSMFFFMCLFDKNFKDSLKKNILRMIN